MDKKKNIGVCDYCGSGGANNPFVAIGGSLAGVFLLIVLFFLIFAEESAALLVPIVWGFVILGIVLAFFVYLTMKGGKRK